MTGEKFCLLVISFTNLVAITLAQSQDTLSQYLVAHYPLDGNCSDLSNQTATAMNKGAIPTKDRMGNPTGAFYFYGVDEKVLISKPSYAPFIGDFTISFWAKSNAKERMQAVSLGSPDHDNISFNLNPDQGIWVYWNGTGYPGILAPLDILDSEWHHLALTRRDSVVSLYVDGEIAGNTMYAGPIGSSSDISLGGDIFPFNGNLDEFKVYSAELSGKQVRKELYYAKPFFTFPSDADYLISNHNIILRWIKDKSDEGSFLDIEFSRDNGMQWEQLSTSNQDTLVWKVPKNLSEDTCYFRIKDEERVLAISTPFLIRSPKILESFAWKKVADDPPFNPKDGVQAVLFKDSIWLLGGWNWKIYPETTTNEIWKSADGEEWILGKSAEWAGRHRFGAFNFQDKLWVIAGDPNQGSYQMDVWSLSQEATSWTQEVVSLPMMERAGQMTASYKGKLWFVGGQQIKHLTLDGDTLFNDVWSSSDGTLWTEMTSHAPWSGRSFGGLVEFKDKLWLSGGGEHNLPRVYFNDIWFTFDGINWNRAKDPPWRPRIYHEFIVFDNKLWVLGGIGDNSRNLNDVWFTEDGATWTELENTPWRPKHAATSFVFKDNLWLGLGSTGNHPTNLENDLWRLVKHLTVDLNERGPKVLSPGDSLNVSTQSLPHLKYQWFRNGLPMPGDSLHSITIKQAGEYSVEVTDPQTGLTGQSSSLKIMISNPLAYTAPTLTVLSDQPHLIGDSTLIVANFPPETVIIRWFHDGIMLEEDVPEIEVTMDGSYYLMVELYNGVRLLSDTVTIDFSPNMELSVTDSLIFLGDKASLSVRKYLQLTYEWYYNNNILKNNTTNSITTLHAGSFYVKAIKPSGKSYESRIQNVTHRKPTLRTESIPFTDYYTVKIDYTICESCDIMWYRNDEVVTLFNDMDSIEITTSGEYHAEILLSDIQHALSTDKTSVSIKPEDDSIFFILNLGNNEIILSLTSRIIYGTLSFKLFSAEGRVSGHWRVIKNDDLLYEKIPTDNLHEGMYIGILEQGNKRFTRRIIKHN